MSFAVNHLVGFGASSGDYIAQSPSAVSTTFTHASDGAAEAQLYDGNDATAAADPAGMSASTRAAYDFGSAKTIRRVRLITATANGFTNTITWNIRYSDTNLTTGFSTVTGSDTQIVATSGTGQLDIALIDDNGAHRYWAIEYASGTASGNAWLGELTFYILS